VERTNLSISFANSIAVVRSSSGRSLGLLESRFGKPLSALTRDYRVRLESFAIGKRSKAGGAPIKSICIIVYGFRHDYDTLGDFLSQNELFLQHPQYNDDSVEYDNPHYLTRPGGVIEIPDQPATRAGGTRHTSDVVKEISDVFETASGPSHYSEVRVSDQLITELKAFDACPSNMGVQVSDAKTGTKKRHSQ
jgi:hypothetical protein